ncbi:hypothetical protein [Kineococcus auxinigenes]|uniref:hypothetical protein n=1 Tax=unclassified Kineococcus TaxID=2621656 RepID=UPI003D7DC9AD
MSWSTMDDKRPTADAAVADDPIQVVRWDAPSWASRGLEVEGGWLHSYEARIVPLEGDEGAERPCPVRLECTDLAYAEGGQTVLRRFGPRVFIGDTTQLSLPEARRLVAALEEVVQRAEGGGR